MDKLPGKGLNGMNEKKPAPGIIPRLVVIGGSIAFAPASKKPKRGKSKSKN